MTTPGRKHTQIIGLDALRFGTALLVVFFHVSFWNWTKIENPGHTAQTVYLGLRPYTWFGWVGVEIFFVLSGFVITYSAQGADCWTFLRHRITRLWPAALICASLTMIVMLASHRHPELPVLLGRLAKSYVFFPRGAYIDSAYWTLSIEIAFYVVVFSLLYFRRLRLLPVVIGSLGAVSTLFWVVAVLLPGMVSLRMQRSILIPFETHDVRNILLVRHGCYFAIGVFLWLQFDKPDWRKVGVLLFCTVGGVLQIIYRTGFIGSQSGYVFKPWLPVGVWLGSLAVMAFATRYNDWIRGLVGAQGERLLRKLGLMTYPLYLLHQVIGVSLIRLMLPGLGTGFALGIAVVVVCGLAYLVSRYLEPLLRRRLDGVLVRSLPQG